MKYEQVMRNFIDFLVTPSDITVKKHFKCGISIRLRSVGDAPDNRKYKKVFENVIEQTCYIMIKAETRSAEKQVV